MDLTSSNKKTKSCVVEHLRLPDKMEPGIYGDEGEKNPNGRLFLGMGSGNVHIWGVFKNGLEPGQVGEMRFHNVPAPTWLPATSPSGFPARRVILRTPFFDMT